MISPDEARERLERGNLRYRESGAFAGRVDGNRRRELVTGQRPLAIVVSCSDSRVLPEAVFSVGLGEIFSIRVAGNVIGEHELGSIQYANEHLGCKLAVVLGHSHCGAVHASLEGRGTGHVASLTDPIRELVDGLVAAGGALDADTVSITNAREGARRVGEAFARTGLEVLPAFYDIESGEVRWL